MSFVSELGSGRRCLVIWSAVLTMGPILAHAPARRPHRAPGAATDGCQRPFRPTSGPAARRPSAWLPAPQRSLHLSLIHISEPTRLGMISYAVFCLKKK